MSSRLRERELLEAIDALIQARLALSNVPWRDQIPDRRVDVERAKARLGLALAAPTSQSAVSEDVDER